MDERRRRRREGEFARREERSRGPGGHEGYEGGAPREHSREDAPPRESGSEVAAAGKEVAHEARERIEEVTRETGHELRRAVETRKEEAADTMERVARAMRRTADSLEEEDVDRLADYPERAAERVDQISRYLRRHDLGDMISDTEAFARRRPELFFGGLALAGMAAGRFLRSSSASRREREPSYRHGHGPSEATPYGDPAYGTTTPAPHHGTALPEHGASSYPPVTPQSPGRQRPDQPTGGGT